MHGGICIDKITAYVDSILNHLDISQAEKAETRNEIIDHLLLGINPITVFHHIPIVLGHQENFYIMLGYVIPNT